ncbi:hypothetical protein HELRODRAFT_90986 [Helobdella robusta]|uniref:Peptidase metallopeptidase domain-containing protein n=1 Tax=Helobdella robusta TaxID=6412 RepID=T1G7Y3_HELRO|nr:hypothetical protein HELRODRAFT_90986 [Helobdella robusta]ESN90183.1 hypothetical protein HELRODRAFT_90986 [Helobdella robusta]
MLFVKNLNNLSQDSWGKSTFTYNIFSYPSKTTLSRDKVDSIIAKAFKIWMTADPKIKVTKTNSKKCDIRINFFAKDHRDGYPFDHKRRNVLAHSFYPSTGVLDFDDYELWGDGSGKTKNLLHTATHEIGHVFGLKHSDVKTAIMYKEYPFGNPPVVLDPDDIKGINFLY